MKLAVSNIGWTAAQDAIAPEVLSAAGATAIEVAPGRVFPALDSATTADAARFAAGWRAAGLPVVSMQALLFGRPELEVFGDPGPLLAHLEHVIALAAALGCGPLVFGSPKNRLKGARSLDEAAAAARPVFRAIGDICQRAGTVFCLEANATGYGCDFMTELAEADAVASAVDHPHVAMVADTGNMMMAGEAPEALLPVLHRVAHVHASAPQLASILPHEAYIADVIGILRDKGYAGTLTLEMRAAEDDDALDGLARAAEMLARLIGVG